MSVQIILPQNWPKRVVFFFLFRLLPELKMGKIVRENNFRNSCKSDAIVEEIFMILLDSSGSSSRNLMILGGKI